MDNPDKVRAMTAVHFLERSDNVRKTDPRKNEWESGFWDVAQEHAQKLVGATLYLHRTKHQPSHFGGRILSYRIEEGASIPRVIFTVRAAADCKDVKAGPRGWAKDCKIVWEALEPAQT
jgi:hypothetical protein